MQFQSRGFDNKGQKLIIRLFCCFEFMLLQFLRCKQQFLLHFLLIPSLNAFVFLFSVLVFLTHIYIVVNQIEILFPIITGRFYFYKFRRNQIQIRILVYFFKHLLYLYHIKIIRHLQNNIEANIHIFFAQDEFNLVQYNNTYQTKKQRRSMKECKKRESNCAHPYYTLKKKRMVVGSNLFKIKKWDEQHIIFSVPEMKQVVKMDMGLNKIVENYVYDDNPSAIDVLELGGHKFIVAGCHSGNIIVKADKMQPKQQISEQQNIGGSQQRQSWIFKPNKGQVYANDIVHLTHNPSIVINCYNNGNIAVWGLLTHKRLHTFQKAHQKYTYKLRMQCENILVSCGNDCSIVRTDLQTQQHIQRLNHPMPVWCAYPIDQNSIASVGLFGRTLVWDVRSSRISQFCNNDRNQSSFVTTRNNTQLSLFYGDANMIIKWDRRKSRPQQLSAHAMGESVQALLFDKDRLFVCGRGNDICVLRGANKKEIITSQMQNERTQNLNLLNNLNQQLWEINNDEQWDEMQDADSSSMQDQSQPLLKEQTIQSKIPIEAVAKLSISDLKQMKESEQNWLAIQQQSDDQDKRQNIAVQKYNTKSYPKRIYSIFNRKTVRYQ